MVDEADDAPSMADIIGEAPAVDPAPARTPRKAKAEPAAEEARLHPILSNDDVLGARAAARKRVEAARRLAAMKQLEEEETQRLQTEEGLTTGVGVKDEIVSVTIDLPLFTEKIVVNMGRNGGVYWHGRTYDVPRHVAESLAEQMGRCWRHEDTLDGKSLSQAYARKRNTVINARTGSISNAPARFDA